LRNCNLSRVKVKDEVHSWSWNSAPGYDSGESSADCLRKTISNPNYVEALKEMEENKGII
jgi:hypothetical protein